MPNAPSPSDTASGRPSLNLWFSLGLTLLGLAVSGYLTWVKLTGNTASCGTVGDCQSVNNSRYAEIGGVPIALFGALGYLALLAALTVERRWPSFSETARLAAFGVSLVGTLYSAYLTYIEVAVLRAICPYCVASAIAMTAILFLCVLRLRAAEAEA
jgi:uncharacterized membrane protein